MAPKALIILSMKGGVGKTTIAVGLAKGLLGRGLNVGLLDLDIHGSAMPRALKLPHNPGYVAEVGGKLQPITDQGLQIFSIGLLFRQEAPNMWSGQQKSEGVQQLVTDSIAWTEEMEWLVMDTPPTSGDEVQSMLEHTPDVHGAVVVTQPADLSYLGLTKTLNLLAENHTPLVGVLLNMAGYTCPHCQNISSVFDQDLGEAEELFRELQVPYLGSVPLAGEDQRQEALEPVVDWVLSGQRLELEDQTEYKGGKRRWLLKQVLR